MPFTYTRTLTDEEMKILENDLVDVQKWIDDAITGKIHKCFARIVKEELSDITPDAKLVKIPTTVGQLVEGHFKKPGYQSRKERETNQHGGQTSTTV